MTSFVKTWVTSSVVQQNVLVSQSAGEERQDAAASQAAAGTPTFWLYLLSLHLTRAPRAEPPLGKGEPEETARAGAQGSGGKQCDLDEKKNSIHTAKILIRY